MSSIANAAARDDVYDLIELAFSERADEAKLARIAEALEESIPRLDPTRFQRELMHVLEGPDLPQLTVAKQMALAALEGRLVSPPTTPASLGTKMSNGEGAREGGLLAAMGHLLRGRTGSPRD